MRRYFGGFFPSYERLLLLPVYFLPTTGERVFSYIMTLWATLISGGIYVGFSTNMDAHQVALFH